MFLQSTLPWWTPTCEFKCHVISAKHRLPPQSSVLSDLTSNHSHVQWGYEEASGFIHQGEGQRWFGQRLLHIHLNLGIQTKQGNHQENCGGHRNRLHFPGSYTGCSLPSCCQCQVRKGSLICVIIAIIIVVIIVSPYWFSSGGVKVEPTSLGSMVAKVGGYIYRK